MHEILAALEGVDSMTVGRRSNARSTSARARSTQALKLLELDGAVARDGGRYFRTPNPWQQDEERIERVIGAAPRRARADAGVHDATTAASWSS